MSNIKQTSFFSLCLFLHVFLFNLVMVNSNGLHFYWQENLNHKALFVYFLTALSGGSVYFITGHIRKLVAQKENTNFDHVWPILSVLVLSLLVLLLAY
ncbi:hypothetical protein Q4489_04035 [Thalassotalea sp. 1_MG-2023]|uniref:hypothetical protein n=1 Tax=Thalassotalea sp. 1_MG-2023 TaxID=3062680 RepID=UPI0026E33742|nr:hypothetical protein [Thalassotalea sp. 1_MG-2023]MDO6426165.1 hypothetical protein [Thalassotalea sp. 1_MG-2023]